MDAVDDVRDTLQAGAEEGEQTCTLPQASVDALYDSGLLRLKLPHVLGGAEADLVTQLDVLEALCEIDASAGWCVMIGAAGLGGSATFLPDDAIEESFAHGNTQTAGVLRPMVAPSRSKAATCSPAVGPSPAASATQNGFPPVPASSPTNPATRCRFGPPCAHPMSPSTTTGR